MKLKYPMNIYINIFYVENCGIDNMSTATAYSFRMEI